MLEAVRRAVEREHRKQKIPKEYLAWLEVCRRRCPTLSPPIGIGMHGQDFVIFNPSVFLNCFLFSGTLFVSYSLPPPPLPSQRLEVDIAIHAGEALECTIGSRHKLDTVYIGGGVWKTHWIVEKFSISFLWHPTKAKPSTPSRFWEILDYSIVFTPLLFYSFGNILCT